MLPTKETLRAPKRSERLRQRAAWMYFVEEMTQSAIAEALGVGRVTVVRMLAEAKALGEVRIALSRGDAELGGLEAALCKLHGLSEAIVAPLSSDAADPTAPIAAALGDHVSALLRNDMKIGLGWGRTLNRSLEYLRERSLKGLSVVSLVGGVTHFAARQPGRVSLRLRARLRRRLLSHSLARAGRQPGDQGGADRALRAQVASMISPAALDAVVVSVGSLGPEAAIARFALIGEADRKTLREYGGVGELLVQRLRPRRPDRRSSRSTSA